MNKEGWEWREGNHKSQFNKSFWKKKKLVKIYHLPFFFFFFFKGEFQFMAFTFNDSSLLSDQDINQFLV